MQSSRSLFQTGIRLQGQSASTGALKTRPFFNIWSDKRPTEHRPSNSLTQQNHTMASATTFFDFTPKDSKSIPPPFPIPNSVTPHHQTKPPPLTPSPEKGQAYPLSQHRNKVILVVNTASNCGFTPQYDALEKLYSTLTSKYPNDFTILAFPCNQFGGQDPGSDEQIQSFCSLKKITFPVLAKTEVNGANAEEVWKWMKKEKKRMLIGETVMWNFEKFLIGRDGRVKGRWASTAGPEGLEKVILEEIGKGREAKA